MGLFRKRTLEDKNKDLARNESSNNGFFSTYNEKRAGVAAKRAARMKNAVKTKDVQKDYDRFSRGAAPALSGGSMYSRARKERRFY